MSAGNLPEAKPAGPSPAGGRRSFARVWTYALAVIATAATLGGRLAFASWFGARPALVLFVLPIFLSAHVGGLGPGLLSTALFAVGSAYFLMPPVHSFAMDSSVDTVLWLVLVLIGVLISVLTESLHAAHRSESLSVTHIPSLARERKVQAGFGFALVFLVVIGAVSIFSVARLREDTGWTTHTEEVISSLRLLLSNLTDSETAERGYLITGAENYLEPYDSARRAIGGELEGLRKLTADNPIQQRQLDKLEPLIAGRLAVTERNVAQRRRQDLTTTQASQLIAEAKPFHDRIRALIAEMEATEQGLLRQREDRAQHINLVTRTVIVIGGSLALVLVTLALFVMNQEFVVRRRAEDALREARDQLEVRVRERTAQLEQTNEALRRGERRFRALIENSGDSIALIDANNRILYLSPSVAAVEGYAPEELIGRNGLENTHPDDLPLIEDKVRELAANPGRPVLVLWRRRHKDGRWLWLEGVATNLLEDPAVGAIVTNYRDVTEQLNAAKALRESEELFSKAFRLSPDCLAIIRLADRTVLRANEAVCSLWGCTPDEIIGKPTKEYTNWLSENERLAFMQKLSEKGENLNYETTFRLHDGRSLRFNVSSRMITLNDESCVLSVMSDITERKKTEVAAAQLAAIVAYSEDAIIGKNLDSVVTSWNAAAERIFGYPAAEMVGQSITRLIPLDRHREEDKILSQLRQGENVRSFETVRLCKDGRTLEVSITASAIRDARGEVIGASKIVRDITERKGTEKRAVWLASFPERNPNPIVELDLADGIFHYLNSAAALQFPDLEKRGLRHPLVAGLVDVVAPLARDGTLRREIAVGEYFLSQMIIRVGETRRVRIYSTDITERKRAEEALEQSRAEFKDLFENAPAGYHTVDAEGRLARINQTELKMLGYTAAELLGEYVWKISAQPETSRRAVMDKLHGIAPSQAFERRLKRKDGSSFPVLIEDQLVKGPGGEIAGIRSVIKDITERKELELALRENEERFRTLANSIPQLAWIARADGYISWYNQRWYDYTGTTPEQMEGWDWPSVHDPKVLPKVMKGWTDAIASGQPFEMEFPLRGADGTFRTFLTRVQPLKDADGGVVQWFGTNTDVETLKQAETSLRASEEYFRFLNDLSEAMRPLADPAQIMSMMARMLGEYLRASRCAYADVADDGEQFTILHDYTDGCVSTVGSYRLSLFGPRAVATLHSGQTLIIRNVETELLPGEGADMFTAIGIKAIITCPLVKDGGLRAMMAVHQTTPRDWQAGEITIVQDVVERCWATIARRTAEEKINQLNTELEQRVIERTAQLADLYNNAPCGYHSLDGAGLFVGINDTELKWLGYAREEIVGKMNATELLTPKSGETFREVYPAFKTSGRLENLELAMVRKDGSILPVLLSATIAADRDGRFLRSRSTIIDYTDRKRADTALQESQVRLEAANKELEAFSYSVSHDLRTPLRAVDGFSQAVLEDFGPKLPDEGRRQLQTIRESAQRMGELIDDLLMFSRLSRQPLRKQTVDPGKIIHAVLAELQATREGRSIEIKIADLPSCQGDPALLKQVWINLLSNALKYTRKQPAGIIEIGAEQQAGGLVYFVRDNGTGFDMRYAHKLFGVFQRLHRAEDYEGTGVGLAIVQRVVQRHGGRIWADSAVDRGATFYFTLEGETNP